MGPVGQIGPPGPTGLKVISLSHTDGNLSRISSCMCIKSRLFFKNASLEFGFTAVLKLLLCHKDELLVEFAFLGGYLSTNLLVLFPGGAWKSRRTRTER